MTSRQKAYESASLSPEMGATGDDSETTISLSRRFVWAGMIGEVRKQSSPGSSSRHRVRVGRKASFDAASGNVRIELLQGNLPPTHKARLRCLFNRLPTILGHFYF